jgi:hypothetical protein
MISSCAKIIIILLIACIMLFIYSNKTLEYMTNTTYEITGYSDENDNYTKPFIMQNLLTKEECNKIINYSGDKLEDSVVVSGKDLSIRNSQQTWIKKNNGLED